MASPRPNLVCLGGSLATVSYSLAACRAVQEFAEPAGFDVQIMDPRKLDLPMYVPHFEIEHYAPRDEGIRCLVEALRQADALVWVSPTYHGTISGVFKNAIDFAEFLCRDSRPYLQGRPVGLVAINDSSPFCALRDCARELRAWVAPTQIQLTKRDFDESLHLTHDRARTRITRLVGELASFVGVEADAT